MPTNRFHDAWIKWLKQVRPNERSSRVRTVAAFMTGLFSSRSVHLSEIAAELPGRAKLPSQERRMRRLLDNYAIVPKLWYAPVARWWLDAVGRQTGEIVLLLDGTKVGANHQLLMVALALKQRTVPIAWTWVACKKGHSTRSKQLALLARVQAWLPPHVEVVIVGDSEFGTVAVIQQASNVWGWGYVLRQKGAVLAGIPTPTSPAADHAERSRPDRSLDAASCTWQAMQELAPQPGVLCFWPQVLLTQRYACPSGLVAYWEPGESEPWLLATNCKRDEALRLYQQRWTIEEMVGDFKLNGFDLESTRLRHFRRLNRLTLWVCLLYTFLMRTGLLLELRGLRSLVDRHDRRDLSYFMLGLRYIKRLLNNGDEIVIKLCPDDLLDFLGRWPPGRLKLSGS